MGRPLPAISDPPQRLAVAVNLDVEIHVGPYGGRSFRNDPFGNFVATI